jgi:hypothetical protein
MRCDLNAWSRTELTDEPTRSASAPCGADDDRPGLRPTRLWTSGSAPRRSHRFAVASTGQSPCGQPGYRCHT